MSHDLSLKEIKKEWHGTLKSYVIGFIASLLLTVLSFSLVITKLVSERTLVYTIIGLAIAQAIVQLLFFLHVGQEEAKPRWASIIFCFTVLILLIVVIGSLWVMHDLNSRMMGDMSHD
jgi:cytochrome o ubiquinol oxidase operon protein cyoD